MYANTHKGIHDWVKRFWVFGGNSENNSVYYVITSHQDLDIVYLGLPPINVNRHYRNVPRQTCDTILRYNHIQHSFMKKQLIIDKILDYD